MMNKRKIEIIFDDKYGVLAKSNASVSSIEIMQGVLILLRNINRDSLGDLISLLENEKKKND